MLHVVVHLLAYAHHVLFLEQLDQGVHVVFRMEDLHADLGAVGVYAVCQILEAGDLAVVEQAGSGGEGGHGAHVAQHNVGNAALGQAGVESLALFGDAAVPAFIAGGQRGEHDAVFQGDVANLDGGEQFHDIDLLSDLKKQRRGRLARFLRSL